MTRKNTSFILNGQTTRIRTDPKILAELARLTSETGRNQTEVVTAALCLAAQDLTGEITRCPIAAMMLIADTAQHSDIAPYIPRPTKSSMIKGAISAAQVFPLLYWFDEQEQEY